MIVRGEPYVVPQSREPTNSPYFSDIFLWKKEENRKGLGRAFILRWRPHERSTVHLGNSDMVLLTTPWLIWSQSTYVSRTNVLRLNIPQWHWTVLPLDVIDLIIDIIAEKKDTDLLKELALISHSFLQICNKHIFSTVELHSANPELDVASSKKGFIKLLKTRPNVVKYIRKLRYITEDDGFYEIDEDGQRPFPSSDNEDDLLSPVLPNLLRTIPLLNCLKICAPKETLKSDWNKLNSSLSSAFLHLIHLPTMNHIDISFIVDFPLSILTSSVNLCRLDMSHLWHFVPHEEDRIVQMKMMPEIRELHTSESYFLTSILLHAKKQDGRPTFNFVDLKRVYGSHLVPGKKE